MRSAGRHACAPSIFYPKCAPRRGHSRWRNLWAQYKLMQLGGSEQRPERRNNIRGRVLYYISNDIGGVHCRPLGRSSDVRSFWVKGQFLQAPNHTKLYYTITHMLSRHAYKVGFLRSSQVGCSVVTINRCNDRCVVFGKVV